jgi:hypothetical protein
VVSAIDLAGWAKMHDVAGPAFVISCETLLHRVLRLCEVAQHVRKQTDVGPFKVCCTPDCGVGGWCGTR